MKAHLAFALLSCFLVSTDVLASTPRVKQGSLEEKITQLEDWSLKKPAMRFNGEKFRNYVKNTPRNYSIVVMLTALQPGRNCLVCKKADEEFQIVANSWRYSPFFNNKLFLAVVDFDDGGDVFQALKINSAPMFIHFPPNAKPNKRLDYMDIQRFGFASEQLARWISERADVQIRVFRPPNYSGVVLVLLTASMIGGLLYFKRNNLEFLYNRNAWATLASIFIMFMTSGQMWNQIRGTPLFHRNPSTGQIMYIHGSSQGQFVIESYLIMLLYAAVVAGVLLMNETSKQNLDPGKKRVFAMVGLIIFIFFFSLLLSIFRSKYPGYPYSLFL